MKNNQKSTPRKGIIGKGGQIEVSFNWIFVLIAGGAILFIFITIANNVQKNSDASSIDIVSQKLQTLLSALEQNPGGIQVQEMLRQEIHFSCEEDGHYYTVKGNNRKVYLNTEKLFSPEIIGDKSSTIAWTLEFDAPYPVSQILYFSDEKTSYIFETSARDIFRKFPEQFTSKMMTIDEIESLEDEGFRKYIIVMRWDATNPQLKSSLERKTTIVKVGDSKIKFIQNGEYNDAPEVAYLNEPTMYGAIISGDSKLYGCAMKKIMKASEIVGEINLKRAEILEQSPDITPTCKLYLNPVGPTFESLQSIIDYSVYPPASDYSALRVSITDLSRANDDMIGKCPSIY